MKQLLCLEQVTVRPLASLTDVSSVPSFQALVVLENRKKSGRFTNDFILTDY